MTSGPFSHKDKQTTWVNSFLATFHQEPCQPWRAVANPTDVKGPSPIGAHLYPSNSNGVIRSEVGDCKPQQTSLRSILTELETASSYTQPANTNQNASLDRDNIGTDSLNGVEATISSLAVGQGYVHSTSNTGERGIRNAHMHQKRNLTWNHSASVTAEGIQEFVQSSDSQFSDKTALVNALGNIFLWEYIPSVTQTKLHSATSTSNVVHNGTDQPTTSAQPVVPHDVTKILQKSSALDFDTDIKLNQLLKPPTSSLPKQDLSLSDPSNSTNTLPESSGSPLSPVHSRSQRTNYRECSFPPLGQNSRRGAMRKLNRCSRPIRKRPPATKSSASHSDSVEKRKQLLDRWLGLEGNQ